MKVTLNIEKRYAYAIGALLLVLIGVVAVNAFTYRGEDFNFAGHGADKVAVWISDDVGAKTLQDAINDGDISGSKRFDGLDDATMGSDPGTIANACVELGAKNPWAPLWLTANCDGYCAYNGYIGGAVIQIDCGSNLISCLCT